MVDFNGDNYAEEKENKGHNAAEWDADEVLSGGTSGSDDEQYSNTAFTPQKKKKKKSKGTRGRKFLKIVAAVLCFCVILGSVMTTVVSVYLVDATSNDAALLNLRNVKLSFTTIIYARDRDTGEYVEYERLYGNENRIWVDYDDMPEALVNAAVAVEDKTFWTHHGVNWKRTIAAFVNAYTPIKLFSSTQGASTITQQLIKNITTEDEVSGIQGALRKLREIFRAIVLEKQYTKQEIIEAYLNTIRLNNNIGGVEAAANTYFGKTTSELTPAEAAAIVGITQQPTRYDPFQNPDNNKVRRNDVLYFMNQQGLLEDIPYEAALAESEEMTFDSEQYYERHYEPYSYFTDQVIEEVVSDLVAQKGMTGTEAENYILTQGLRIYTSCDPNAQAAIQQVFADAEYVPTIGDPETDPQPQAAMAVLNYNGELIAVAGGLGEKTASRVLNRATQSVRQTGSSMKPIGVYALAIEKDLITFSTLVPDKPVQAETTAGAGLSEWPRNYDGTYGADATVALALRKSLNTVAVRVLQRVTPEASYNFLTTRLGISSLVDYMAINGDVHTDIALAPLGLGALTHGISCYEMAAAYAIFGNGGKYVTPHAYISVESTRGEVIVEPEIITIQAISGETSMIMNRLMQGVIYGTEGTGASAAFGAMPIAGKTGTSSDYNDYWFCGLTPYYVGVIWYGYDIKDYLPINYNRHPVQLTWRDAMSQIQDGLDYKDFPTDPDVVAMAYCTVTGDLPGAECTSTEMGYYKSTAIPGTCAGHAYVDIGDKDEESGE